MKQPKYDIFISYRRDGGAQYARTLQLMLEKKGYKVFLDYDELTDGEFSPKIIEAIKEAPIYMIILSKGSMLRCVNEGDWVRKELEYAISLRKRIIPINPDNTFDGVPKDVPESVKHTIECIQHSEIGFGQSLHPLVNQLIKNRIQPYIKRRTSLWLIIVSILFLIISVVFGFILWFNHKKELANLEIKLLKESVVFQNVPLSWAPDITKEQILTVKEILDSMSLINRGEFFQGALPLSDGSYHETVKVEFETPAFLVDIDSFFLSKTEVTVGQWNAIMCDSREGDSKIPVASVSFYQVQEFIHKLRDLSGIQFRIPSESEWEYAAKGGSNPEGFVFAGSNNPNDVAWYSANSGGIPHSDLLAIPTVDDLFNMSGNVSEWTDTEFKPYDNTIPYSDNLTIVTKGGNFDSEPYELSVTRRDPVDPDTAIPTLGFRLAIDK